MRESQIEKKVVDYAKRNSVFTLKLSGQNDRGKADRIFMKKGKAIFVEFKALGKLPTKLQQRFLETRRADGFTAESVDSETKGISLLSKEFNL